MLTLYWFDQTLWLEMNGSHILSQLWNGPLHICDISTIDGCNFQSVTTHPSLFYFHPLIFFFSFSSVATLLFTPTLALSEFLLLAIPCYLSLLIFPCLFPLCDFFRLPLTTLFFPQNCATYLHPILNIFLSLCSCFFQFIAHFKCS